jgi:hypothetical protein
VFKLTDDKLTKAIELKKEMACTQRLLGVIKFNCHIDECNIRVDDGLVEVMNEYCREKLNKLQKEFDEL